MINSQVCPVCQVTIENDGSGFPVKFTAGAPGTLGRLYVRVCQYSRDSRCINKDKSSLIFHESDYYRPDLIVGLEP